jgi:hypothetical protein
MIILKYGKENGKKTKRSTVNELWNQNLLILMS